MNSTSTDTLGGRIGSELKRSGISMRELARRIDIAQPSISKWCSNQAVPRVIYLERMAKVDGNTPMCDSGTLKDVLKRIDNVMEWRFVNALGEVVLDGDILAESIDCEALRTMRYCVAEYLKRIEERGAEEESDE